ncbi:MAG TPA: NaeI family type II restriction endonuclease [Terracidiphilus sp.]|jgi:hypothetical protein|nr:NaeI family type II restriction endonuclease [Terracidiphilus sp.]
MASSPSKNVRQNEAQSDALRNDADLIARIEAAIYKGSKGAERFREYMPSLLRRATDAVIDGPGTGRFTIDELEKTEKTYLGTKVEILLRSWLELPKGNFLDLLIDGIEVDIKNTMASNWMIPAEAIGHPCLLVKTSEKLSRFSIGIVVARDEHLSAGKNRDGKRAISAQGRDHIHWVLRDQPYPENIWSGLDPELRKKIVSYPPGTKRVAALFRLVQQKPISRVQVVTMAPQRDGMKRLRKNGGARDSLAHEGIAILSGCFDKTLIGRLNLPRSKNDEFISYQPQTESDKALLRSLGKID